MSVFCLLGLSILQDSNYYHLGFIAAVTFACIISRAGMLFPITALLNLRRPPETKITMKMQVAIWNAGLRGAVAYALTLKLPETMPGRAVFVTTIHAGACYTCY